MKFWLKHERSPEAQAWIDAEASAQLEIYAKIVKEMDDLEPERERWIEEFLERIQTRGYHVHADILRVIKPEEIPVRPNRKLRVVY